ncbi:hypothetical protein [Roseovarius sp. A-2]|uniref:hypothetical protein n=1 Tax=Roseovarius sp. A-2 TaxID=1570360 RepID=UPI00111A2DE1|nr:hypothetical protein [Roseovarius sp. A-2]
MDGNVVEGVFFFTGLFPLDWKNPEPMARSKYRHPQARDRHCHPMSGRQAEFESEKRWWL